MSFIEIKMWSLYPGELPDYCGVGMIQNVQFDKNKVTLVVDINYYKDYNQP